MSSIIRKIANEGYLPDAPAFALNTEYEAVMGSYAYGVSNDMSDRDIRGICIPDRKFVFPADSGLVYGFDQYPKFFNYQRSGVTTNYDNRNYDIQVFSIVRFFVQAIKASPETLDFLFAPKHAVLHKTAIGNYLLKHRRMFLSKKCYKSFKMYAYSQLNKLTNKKFGVYVRRMREFKLDPNTTIDEMLVAAQEFPQIVKELGLSKRKIDLNNIDGDRALSVVPVVGTNAELMKILLSAKLEIDREPPGKRKDTIIEFGYDVKFAYHIVRLIDEIEQILTEGNIELGRNREQMKQVRKGEWTLDELKQYFREKEAHLSDLYTKSELPEEPEVDKLKEILLECLDMKYGELGYHIVVPNTHKVVIQKIKELFKDYDV